MEEEAEVARVLYCVEYDEVTEACTAQAWFPAPSLLPPLTTAEVVELFGLTAAVFAVAWAWKQVGRAIRD